MVCLDTDISIDFLKKDIAAFKKITVLKKENKNISTTTINAFELLRGNYRLSDESKSAAVETLLNNVTIHTFNLESSRIAAKIFENLRLAGAMIELTDVMIAAICISNNEPLLTRNTKHFTRIPDLQLEKI